VKAIVFENYGSPNVLQLEEVQKPSLKHNEVMIRIYAATVIAGDCELRRFNFPLWFGIPFRLYVRLVRPKRINILGQELAGVIESVGKDVTRFRQGDQVFGATAKITLIRLNRELSTIN